MKTQLSKWKVQIFFVKLSLETIIWSLLLRMWVELLALPCGLPEGLIVPGAKKHPRLLIYDVSIKQRADSARFWACSLLMCSIQKQNTSKNLDPVRSIKDKIVCLIKIKRDQRLRPSGISTCHMCMILHKSYTQYENQSQSYFENLRNHT